MNTDWASTASESAPSSSRRKVWGGLAVLLVAALGLLALAMTSGDGASSSDDPDTIRFRVVDEQGRPISHAEVFVLASEDMPAGGAGEWSDADATLTLPIAVQGSAIAVQARGYRSDVVKSVTEDLEFVLQHGLVIRLEVQGGDAEAAGDTVLVFQVIPEPTGDLTADQLAKIADLIATLEPQPDGGVMLRGGDVGFAVQAAIAEQGLLIPLAGRYGVRWGLLDPKSKMWYSLPEDVRAVIDVADDRRTQVFAIPVSAEAIQKTRQGLSEQIRQIRAR